MTKQWRAEPLSTDPWIIRVCKVPHDHASDCVWEEYVERAAFEKVVELANQAVTIGQKFASDLTRGIAKISRT